MGDDIGISSVVHRGLANCFGGKRKSTGFDHVQLRIEADGQSHQRPKVLGNVRLVGGDNVAKSENEVGGGEEVRDRESSTVMLNVGEPYQGVIADLADDQLIECGAVDVNAVLTVAPVFDHVVA